jgi:hypothetical protein
VVLNVFKVVIQAGGEGSSLRPGVRFWRGGNDPIACGGKLGFLDACPVRGVLGVRPSGFAVPFALVPPLDEVAALGMRFVIPVDADVVTSYAALGVVQGGSMNPSIVDFDLFEKLDVGGSWHLAVPRPNRP